MHLIATGLSGMYVGRVCQGIPKFNKCIRVCGMQLCETSACAMYIRTYCEGISNTHF